MAELKSSLHRHDELYYRKAQPEISDQEYDRLRRDFEQLESELDPLGLFSEETDNSEEQSNEVALEVGDDRLDSFQSHHHAEVMLSLDNTYDQSEFFDFDKRLKKILAQDCLTYVVEPKIDGVAVSLSYEKENCSVQSPGVMGLRGILLPKIFFITLVSCPAKSYPNRFLILLKFGVKSTWSTMNFCGLIRNGRNQENPFMPTPETLLRGQLNSLTPKGQAKKAQYCPLRLRGLPAQ